MAIKVGDLVFYTHGDEYAYGVISRITGGAYWSYFNNDGGKELQCSDESLTKVGHKCMGVWNERDCDGHRSLSRSSASQCPSLGVYRSGNPADVIAP